MKKFGISSTICPQMRNAIQKYIEDNPASFCPKEDHCSRMRVQYPNISFAIIGSKIVIKGYGHLDYDFLIVTVEYTQSPFAAGQTSPMVAIKVRPSVYSEQPLNDTIWTLQDCCEETYCIHLPLVNLPIAPWIVNIQDKNLLWYDYAEAAIALSKEIERLTEFKKKLTVEAV